LFIVRFLQPLGYIVTPDRQSETLILSRSSHWGALFTIHDMEMVFLHQLPVLLLCLRSDFSRCQTQH
jgi:hypothetical protein